MRSRAVFHLILWIVIGIFAVCQSGCFSSRHGSRNKLVSPSVLEAASLQYYWQAKLPLRKGETVRNLWRCDENLYALTNRNRLIATDAVSGKYLWSFTVRGTQRVFAPCHVDKLVLPKSMGIQEILEPNPKDVLPAFDAVVISTLSKLMILNRRTGQLVREFDLKFAANTPGCSDGVHYYVASVKGRYYAIRLADGLCQWEMSTDDVITARPRLFGGHLYVASQDGKFRAIDPTRITGNRYLWQQLTDGPISADFVVDRRGCFVPSEDYRLYAYDNLTGDTLWTFVTQGPLRQAVQVGHESVFQYAYGDRFYAIDIAKGRERWSLPEGRLVLACAKMNRKSYVFVLDCHNQLLLVREMLGKVEKSVPMNGLDLFIPNSLKPVIFAASKNGLLVCITPKSVKNLTSKMLREHPYREFALTE